MTTTSTVFPIVAALATARIFGKATSPWIAAGPGAAEQERYIPLLEKLQRQCSAFSPEELRAIASTNHEVINKFLKDNGFQIELSPFTDPNDFGVASDQEVLVKWKTRGRKYDLVTPDGNLYPGARLEEDVTYSRVEGYQHDVAHIACENGDVVHMTVADRHDLSGLDLLEKVMTLSNGKEYYRYDAVVFPMVDLDQEVDISFFLEMGFMGTGAAGDKGRLYIKEAKQQTKFKMNHLGAKVKSAAAFAMTLECCRMPNPDLVIDQPFYTWMTRPDVDVPYFAGFIDTSNWKDPGGLDDGEDENEYDDEGLE